MENISIIEKIKSNYILQNILSYIDDKQFLTKLFFHSKNLQKKYNINIFNYQEEFLNNRIKWEDYLCFISLTSFTEESKFKKDTLKKTLNKILSDYGFSFEDNTIKKIITNYFFCKNEKNNQKFVQNDDFYHIDIYSPFFDLFSKSEIFDEIFLIQIPFDLIKENRLIKDYISIFHKLNFKYSSIRINIEDLDQIKYINDLKIDFKKVKNLYFQQYQNKYEKADNNNIQFAKNILSLIESADKLVYFYLSLNFQKISSQSCQFINNCKLLEYLTIRDISFTSTFTLNLPNLKKLELFFCYNVELSKEINSKLNYLTLYNTYIYNFKQLDFPELEEIHLDEIQDMVFQNLKKIKKFAGNLNNLKLIGSQLLEEINIEINSFQELKTMMEKITSFKLLKKITLKLNQIKDEGISDFIFENTSVKEMHIYYKFKDGSCKFYSLQNKFINLSDLFIDIFCKGSYYSTTPPKYELLENPNSKVKNIHLYLSEEINEFKIYFQSYEKLESIYLNMTIRKINLENFFPLFNDKCNIIFKSLKSFTFRLYLGDPSFNIINNLYNNLDNTPNLIDFNIYCHPSGLNEDFYKKFIKKILSMKYIKRIDINILSNCDKFYSKKELKKLFPDINFNKFYEVNIKKPDSNSCTIY